MKQNQQKNRPVFLSSMGSSQILTNEAEIQMGQNEFTQFSWTFEEYEAALKDTGFKLSVARELAPPESS